MVQGSGQNPKIDLHALSTDLKDTGCGWVQRIVIRTKYQKRVVFAGISAIMPELVNS